MNDSSNRKLETCRRVRDFNNARAAHFAPTSLATQLFATLSTGIDTLEGLAAQQTSGGGAAREGTATRGDAREELRSRMKAWSSTAHAIAIDNPGLEHKFRVPRGENDEILIAAARAFATDAVPLSAHFIAHEMPATFIDDMNASILKLNNTMSKQSSAVGDRVGARAAIEAKLDECMTVVRKLDPIMRNKYADDPPHSPNGPAPAMSSVHRRRRKLINPERRQRRLRHPDRPPVSISICITLRAGRTARKQENNQCPRH